jgi:hypothetical protein
MLICVLLIILVSNINSSTCSYVTDTAKGQISTGKFNSGVHHSFAICLTGYLPDLEIGSKIARLIKPNLARNLGISLFAYLLNQSVNNIEISNLKSNILKLYTESELSALIYDQVRKYASSFRAYVRIVSSPSDEFLYYPGDFRSSFSNSQQAKKHYFQREMLRLLGLRECMKLVGKDELERGKPYDFVVRIKENIYILRELLFQPQLYSCNDDDVKGHVKSALKSSKLYSFSKSSYVPNQNFIRWDLSPD